MYTHPIINRSKTQDKNPTGARKIPASSGGQTFGELNRERQRLVTAMQKNPFSRIEHLQIRDGNPVFGPATRWTVETKLGTSDLARPEAVLADFALKREHIELFSQLDLIGSGEILALEVRAGLPFRIIRQVAV